MLSIRIKLVNLLIVLYLLTWHSNYTNGQIVINHELAHDGNIQLSDDVSIPRINSGYTLWLPDSGRVDGLIVFTHPRRDTLTPDNMISYALSRQLGVIYITTDNRFEFLFNVEQFRQIEQFLEEVITTYSIPSDNLLYCGMSLEGTRALRMTILSSIHNPTPILPKAIAICDAPLDMIRFHKELLKAKNLNFQPAAANEGAWVSAYLESNLNGTPHESIDRYIEYSPYSYIADGGPHLTYFKNIAIRAYTEPDVLWWMKTRRKDYYAMNSIDLAGFVNELNILGNEKAQLILTADKGIRDDGSRHPHSWNIVDEKEMIDWFLKLPD